MRPEIKVVLASPRGFCAGVVRAIETVNLTLRTKGAPVYVLHEIVHNKHVISELEKQGAIFVKELTEIPTGEICIFSAHGVSVQIEEQARKLGLRTIDATCPLVSSIHQLVEKYCQLGYDVIIMPIISAALLLRKGLTFVLPFGLRLPALLCGFMGFRPLCGSRQNRPRSGECGYDD